MRKASREVFFATLMGLCLSLAVGGVKTAGAQEGAAAPASAEDFLRLRVKAQPNGALVGLLQNSGARAVRDVRLLVRHTWLWKNERHPGPASDNPGRSAYYMVDGEVPAAGELRFRYTPSPALPVRTDGSFATTAEIVGFVEAAPAMAEDGGRQ